MNNYAETQEKMESARKVGNARQYVNLGDKLGIPEDARDPHLQAEVDLQRTKYVPITEDVAVNPFADLKLPEPSEFVFNTVFGQYHPSKTVDPDEMRARLGELRSRHFKFPVEFRKGVMPDEDLRQFYQIVKRHILGFKDKFSQYVVR